MFGIFRSFPGFELSGWNLVYTCSRWCYTSSSSFIPIGTLCPTSQPKIGQSHLSAFMALKIIWRPQIWYIHLYCKCLDPYWFSSWLGNFWHSGGQKHLKGGVTRAPSQWKVFRTFFCKCCEISVWNLEYTSSGWCHTSSSSFIPIWTFWHTLQPKIGQRHLSAFMALKIK